jgi:hypothetical protein
MRVVLNEQQYKKNCDLRVVAILHKAQYSAEVGAKAFTYKFFAADALDPHSYEEIAEEVTRRSEGTVVKLKSTTKHILFNIVKV